MNEDPNVALIRQLRAEIEELRQLLSAQSSQPEIPLDMEKIDGDKEILRATNAALKIQVCFIVLLALLFPSKLC